jgi:sugar lactone lactonase YvrE
VNNAIQCAVPAGDICGEGAVWHPEQSALYWTDINRFLVHRFDPTSQATNTWLFDEPVTSVNLTTDPNLLLLVMGSQIAFWSPRNHPHPHPNVAPLFRLPAWPHMRFNDARVDPRGSLWVGTMRNNVGPDGENLEVEYSGGVLYRVDPDGAATEWKTNIGISNTVAWSPDHDTFYFGDSIANAIRSYRYNSQTGEISAETPLLVGHPQGLPDGSAMDAEGYLWNARYDGCCVIRISPTGFVDRILPLPVSRPTTCAFGGPRLETLYITSARCSSRLSGSIFAIEPEVCGMPDGKFLKR